MILFVPATPESSVKPPNGVWPLPINRSLETDEVSGYAPVNCWLDSKAEYSLVLTESTFVKTKSNKFSFLTIKG
jgi:hypothetical protein